jgi:hypothetical protein
LTARVTQLFPRLSSFDLAATGSESTQKRFMRLWSQFA